MTTEEARKLFVAGLPDSITEDVLRQLFEATGGTVVEVSLPRDRATGRPRGFGFVTLSTSVEAASARDSLDGTMQAGKTISVRPFQSEPPKRGAGGPVAPGGGGGFGGGGGGAPGPRGQGGGYSPDRTIYVGNLPYDVAQEEVESLLTGMGPGTVVRVTLPTDESGRKRGFGFVTMASAEAAASAMETLRGAQVRGRELVVNLAHPKGERRDDAPGGAAPGGPSPGGAAPGFQRPRTFDNAPLPPSGGGPGARKPEKRRGPAEGGRRTKAWDREREGRGGDDWGTDWDDDRSGRGRGNDD